MSSTFPQRVAFEDHRFMQAIDLEDEQLYHLQRRWQHNLSLHSWGILCGLEVRINGTLQQQPNVVIYPGMALDGHGRELVVTNLLSVLESYPSFNPEITYDIWVTYGFSLDDNATGVVDCSPEGLDDCDSPPDTNLHRIVEQPQVIVRPTSERQSGSVTQPREVPIGDLFFTPDRPMKFDPSTQWPVFLCKLQFIGTAWAVDATERHYGGLIAERIEMPFQKDFEGDPPKRQTAILNGGHPDRRDWRFAVLDVPAPKVDVPSPKVEVSAPNSKGTNSTGTAPKPVDAVRSTKTNRDLAQALPDDVPAPLSVRAVSHVDSKNVKTTETEIRWQAERVVAEADLVMRGGAGIQFEATPVGETPTPPTSVWGIFRNFRPPVENPKDSNFAQFADVLQVSMPQSDAGLNSVAIGAVDADGKFSPILVVNNDESVDINGVLRVHGDIFGGTSDLPPLNRTNALAKIAEKLTASLQDSSVPHQLRQKFATAVADGAGSIDDGSGSTDFASGIKNAQHQTDIYLSLAQQIVDLMKNDATFTNAFAGKVKLADDDGEKKLYTEIATQIVDLMKNDAAFATAFAGNIKLADDDGEKKLYTELATQIVDLMKNDAAFATAFAGKITLADNDGEKVLYNALARQMVELMAHNPTDANNYALNLVDATPFDVSQTEFCKAMLTRASSLLNKDISADALGLSGSKWDDILEFLWKTSTRAQKLGQTFSNATLTAAEIDQFVSGLTPGAASALKARLP